MRKGEIEKLKKIRSRIAELFIQHDMYGEFDILEARKILIELDMLIPNSSSKKA